MARKKAQALPQPEPEMLTVCGDILQETEDAILLACEGENYWLPKSQIEYEGERGDEYVEVTLPDWLAEEKGLSDRQGYVPPASVAATDVTEEQQETLADTPIADTDADDEGEPGASTVDGDRHWLKQETITVTQQLTQKEKAEYAEEMAQLDDEIEELENERDSVMKSLKKQIDAKEDERRTLSKVVRNGNEEREIFCDKLADYNTCEMVWTDAHPPHDEVKRQKMTSEERQLPLEKKVKPDHTAVDAEAPSPDAEGMDFDALTLDAETERSCKTCLHDGAVNDDGEPCESCDENLSLWQPKPEDEPTHECSNCANTYRTFSETDVDPCHECSDEAKEHWTPMNTDTAIPAGEQVDAHSGVVQ